MGKYYITTTLPYVNAEPHVGFALEIIRADVLARVHKLSGDEVFFNTGTDEHGQKIYQKAVENKQAPKEYCDEYAAKFDLLKTRLDLSYNNFIRTTDEHHIVAAQEFWKRCFDARDIYKNKYQIKYCIGCELEKTDSELIDGRCPVHPKMEIEMRDEENYFFRFSRYQERLLKLYDDRPDFIVPEFRREEMKGFVKNGLVDFSVSRLKSKMPWGVEVPGDPDQVMYVWFDALVSYISALDWPNKGKFEEFWPGNQICGKDNLRQQSAMWQAMLMSAGLPNSKQIYVEGFITADGVKMSKSLGNVIDPIEYVDRYGTDALRYFLLSQIDSFEDSPMTRERFEKVFQADLANGLSNLVARVTTMIEKSELRFTIYELRSIRKEVVKKVREYRFNEGMGLIWDEVRLADEMINQKEVWKLIGDEKSKALKELVEIIRGVGVDLQPFMPETSEKILAIFGKETITRGENLFNRIKDPSTALGMTRDGFPRKGDYSPLSRG